MEKLGLWTSGWDQTATDLVEEVYRNFGKKTSYVFLSREEGETRYGDLMIQKVRELGLPLITFSSLRFQPDLRGRDQEAWRLEHDREVMKLLPPVDLIVLLGYMWIVGKEMCQEYILINLHPALPDGPKGTYRDVIWQLIREKATETGVMIHLVIEELDMGPPIAVCHFPIRGGVFDPLWEEMERRLRKESLEEIAEKEGEDNPLFTAIRKKGVIRELPMVIQAIRVLLTGRIKIENSKVVDSEGQILEGGYSLTSEIDAAVKDQIEKGV